MKRTHYAAQTRSARDRIITAEVAKLEQRRKPQQKAS